MKRTSKSPQKQGKSQTEQYQNCAFHPSQRVKYICTHVECGTETRIFCPECFSEGPHECHSKQKLSDFQKRFQQTIQNKNIAGLIRGQHTLRATLHKFFQNLRSNFNNVLHNCEIQCYNVVEQMEQSDMFQDYRDLCDTINHMANIDVKEYKKKEADLALNIVIDGQKFLDELSQFQAESMGALSLKKIQTYVGDCQGSFDQFIQYLYKMPIYFEQEASEMAINQSVLQDTQMQTKERQNSILPSFLQENLRDNQYKRQSKTQYKTKSQNIDYTEDQDDSQLVPCQEVQQPYCREKIKDMFNVMENHIQYCNHLQCKRVYMRGYIGYLGYPTKCQEGQSLNDEMDEALNEIKTDNQDKQYNT